MGHLYLRLKLGSFSSAELSDIDPTDILALISSIGGFWGECRVLSGPPKLADDVAWRYLGIQPTSLPYAVCCILVPSGFLNAVWSFFFISTVESKPEEKARNSKKDIEKGKRLLRRERSSPPIAVTSDAQAGGDEQSNWDIAHGGPLEAIGNTNSDRVPEIESTV